MCSLLPGFPCPCPRQAGAAQTPMLSAVAVTDCDFGARPLEGENLWPLFHLEIFSLTSGKDLFDSS